MAGFAGKTRTTSAHGPTAGKKAFKATTTPSKPSSAAATAYKKPYVKTPRPSGAPVVEGKPAFEKETKTQYEERKKRKAEEDAREPEKPKVVNSVLNAPEEIDFPRGGGTNLTQVEVREAQLEGEREAMDEDSDNVSSGSEQRRGETADSRYPQEKAINTEVVDKSKAKRRRLEREAGGAIKEKNLLPKDAFRVEHLNYKRLVPGTKVLAQIILIRPLELIVSLPNQLLAHIPITNISTEYTTRLEASGESSDEEESEEESDEEEEGKSSGLPGLNKIFKEGQWVSAIVMESKANDSKAKLGGREGDENVRASRRVELSLEPEKVNEGIARGDLRAGFTLTSSVKSVEDHGYILSLGLPSLTSFLTFKDAKKLQPTRLEVGQIIACRIKDVSENGRTCNVTVGKADVTGSILSTAASITSILPSTLVTALVTATLSSGLNVKFFGYFDGTVDLFHLNGQDPEKDFKVGQKVKARVLWDSLATTPKKFSLSLAKHVLNLGVAGAEFEEDKEEEDLKVRFPVGRILEGVSVVRMDDEWGLTCEIVEGEASVAAFVHISRITDDHLASIPKTGPWKAGTVHRARVINYSAVDGLVQLSLQPSVLEQAFLRVSDVKVGEIIKGTIKRLSDSALFVSISGNVDGVVWPMHYADIKLKHPEKKFKVGASVKARIYSADPVKNRVVLTLKKQLITSELPIVTCLEDAKVGVVTHGTVTKVLEKGVLVDFFGGMRALIPAGEAAEGFTSDLSLVFSVGKVIPVRIIAVDPVTSKIVASARQAHDKKPEDTTTVEIGNVLSGTVSALHDTNVVLALQPSGVKALMSYSTLARHRKTTVDALRAELAKGQTLEDLVVVSKNADKGFVIVGLIPSKAKRVEGAPSNVTFESLKVGQKLAGRICGKVPTGLLVEVSKSVRGRVPRTEISDDFGALETPATVVGAQVECVVLSLDPEHNRADFSLRASRIQDGVKAKDVAIESLDDLKPGQAVRGFVKNVAGAGLFVSLGTDITARVLIKELFDEFVKDWKPRFVVGQVVEGKITAVNKVANQVEMSLRKNAEVKASTVEIGDLVKGQVVRGVIRRVETYGAFIKIAGSNMSGLCHKSKVTDDEGTAWTEFVHEGDEVKAIITEINTETKKISLGLKASLFPEGDSSDEDEEDGSEDDDEDAEMLDDGMDDSDDDDEDAEDGSEEESDEDVEIEDAEAIEANSGRFHDDAEEEADANEESEEEETIAEPKAKRSDVLEDKTGASQAPTSIADFERLLLGAPNSSYLWIQFIAFFVALSQVDKAREIGRRALKSINFREEQEKLNVWVALLNLENSYGNAESLEELFKEAAQSNDAKTVYLRMIDIYERSNKFEAEEELFQKLVKKFGQSSKAWTLFGQFYLTRGRAAEARELLPRSLKSLEKRKHVKTISKFAQLEFKLGDAERGRTIFEGIMDSYPKRLDLWFVYIDMEIKQKNTTGVRALFDRVLANRLSSKKGKSVFKKWLSFEKEAGDEAGVEACKARALAFVESLS
ncbi:rRNA biogenesis protein RRP5, partial [Phenoliferia sp. Uapishka_3]